MAEDGSDITIIPSTCDELKGFGFLQNFAIVLALMLVETSVSAAFIPCKYLLLNMDLKYVGEEEGFTGTSIRRKDKVNYLSDSERREFEVSIENGQVLNNKKQVFADTGEKQMIVISEDLNIYVGGEDKVDNHSSFVQGRRVIYAGEIRIKDGQILLLSDRSGHYSPGLIHTHQALLFFDAYGVDFSKMEVKVESPLGGLEVRSLTLPAQEFLELYDTSPGFNEQGFLVNYFVRQLRGKNMSTEALGKLALELLYIYQYLSADTRQAILEYQSILGNDSILTRRLSIYAEGRGQSVVGLPSLIEELRIIRRNNPRQ